MGREPKEVDLDSFLSEEGEEERVLADDAFCCCRGVDSADSCDAVRGRLEAGGTLVGVAGGVDIGEGEGDGVVAGAGVGEV